MVVHPGITAGALSGLVAALGLIGALARSLWRAASEAQKNAEKIAHLIEDVETLKQSDQEQTIALAVAKAVDEYAARQAGHDTKPA